MELEKLYALYLQSHQVVIDSRNVTPGDLFFALKGEHSDGNIYAEKALAAGALASVVDRPELADVPGCFYVEDVLSALQALARRHRCSFTFPVIGLTGSNGKTTTKELIHAVLQSTYHVQATKGNLNNHIGVPLTLLSVREKLDYLIVEMGANHQGEIEFLCGISQPDYGLITNIGKAHLEGFGGIEGVKKGKSELYRHIQKQGGALFVNGEDDVLSSLVPNLAPGKIHKYFPSVYKSAVHESMVYFHYKDADHPTLLSGAYNLANIAAVIKIGEFFGVTGEHIVAAISGYYPDNNRSQIKDFQGLKLIMDAYNANPSSMKASIENFINLKEDEKILVLGDMFELGEYSAHEHSQLLQWIIHHPWRQVILIGQQFLECQIPRDNFKYFPSVDAAKPFFQSFYHSGALVLMKGSRGIALEKLLQ